MTINFPKVLTIVSICLAFLFVVFLQPAYAEKLQILKSDYAVVLYNSGLKSSAQKVLKIYPETKDALTSVFSFRLAGSPSIILIKNRSDFVRLAGDSLTVAFAVPSKNLIVIDYSRMITSPFSLQTTLKHELCHLLLHQHIKDENLPRWLDEGLCMWASEGIAEIIMDPKRSYLERAAVTKGFIPLNSLRYRFPADKKNRLLAYEESKSFINYLVSRFKKEKLLAILHQMEKGDVVDKAVLSTVSFSLNNLEEKWQKSLDSNLSWFTYLSYNLYEILFAVMAILTVYGFVRLKFRKRFDYDEEDGDYGNGEDNDNTNLLFR